MGLGWRGAHACNPAHRGMRAHADLRSATQPFPMQGLLDDFVSEQAAAFLVLLRAKVGLAWSLLFGQARTCALGRACICAARGPQPSMRMYVYTLRPQQMHQQAEHVAQPRPRSLAAAGHSCSGLGSRTRPSPATSVARTAAHFSNHASSPPSPPRPCEGRNPWRDRWAGQGHAGQGPARYCRVTPG